MAADCDAAWPGCHQTVDGSYHQCQLIGLLAATFCQAASRHLPSLQRQPRCPHLILTEPLYRFRPPVATAA